MVNLIEKFMNNVSKPDGERGCWLWTKGRSKDGYGKCRVLGIRRAHRASYTLFKGVIPNGLHVLHTCDNPPCVNPNHLWLGTSRNNIDDMLQKKRSLAGEKSLQAKLTNEQVKAIRSEYIPRKGGSAKGSGGRGAKGKYPGSMRLLAEKYGVNRVTIKRIVQNKSWKHII